MRIEIYRDTKGGFRWRLKAANGKTIADGAEGYTEKRGVNRAIKLLWSAGLRVNYIADQTSA